MSSADAQGRYVVDVLANSSNYITATVPASPTAPPADTTQPVPVPSSLPAYPQATQLQSGTDGASAPIHPSTSTTTPGDFETALLPTSGTGGVYQLSNVDLLTRTEPSKMHITIASFPAFEGESGAFPAWGRPSIGPISGDGEPFPSRDRLRGISIFHPKHKPAFQSLSHWR